MPLQFTENKIKKAACRRIIVPQHGNHGNLTCIFTFSDRIQHKMSHHHGLSHAASPGQHNKSVLFPERIHVCIPDHIIFSDLIFSLAKTQCLPALQIIAHKESIKIPLHLIQKSFLPAVLLIGPRQISPVPVRKTGILIRLL